MNENDLQVVFFPASHISLRGGRSPKVSLGFTYVVVCLGFIEDSFRVYLGLVCWIFFTAYLGFV